MTDDRLGKSRPVIAVVSMHRTGTSAFTGILHLLGFSAGKHLVGANQFNQKGYFEDTRLNVFYDRVLAEFGLSWDDPRALPIDWLSSLAIADLGLDLANCLVEEFDLTRPCAMKDPRAARLLPLLKSALSLVGVTDLKCVITLRKPAAVVASLQLRDGIAAAHAALLYSVYLLDAELHSRTCGRSLVKYADLLDDWRSVIIKIDSELHLEIASSGVIEKSGAAIDRFLERDLDHSSQPHSDFNGPVFDLANDVFQQFSIDRGLNETCAFDALRERLDLIRDGLEPWLGLSCRYIQQIRELPSLLVNPSERLLSDVSVGAQSELFWASEPLLYAQAQSVSAAWRYGAINTVQFTLPSNCGLVSTLRIDITDRPAFCTIHNITVKDQTGRLLLDQVPCSDLFEYHSDDWICIGLCVKTGGLKILCTGFDAHATLRLPADVLTSLCAGFSVALDFSAEAPASVFATIGRDYASAKHSLSVAFNQTSSSREEVEQLTNLLKDSHALNQRLIEEVSTTSKSVHVTQGQIETLKLLFDAATTELTNIKKRDEKTSQISRSLWGSIKSVFAVLFRIR